MLLNALTGRVKEHNWPVGPLLAQSAHAATAVLHRFRDHPDVERYLKGEDGRGWEGMRKVVLEVCRPFSLFFFFVIRIFQVPCCVYVLLKDEKVDLLLMSMFWCRSKTKLR